MVLSPPIAEFVAANREFRQAAGGPVVFSIPTTPTWPGGTLINPDTSMPYDALVQPTNPEYTTVTITCLVVLKEASPLRPQPDVHFEPAGVLEGMDIILDVDSDDWPTVQNASEFAVNGKTYLIEENKPFSTGGVLYRYLVYGAEK